MSTLIDLHQPKFSYFFGLLQSDGNLQKLSRGRGKVTIELKQDDLPILERLQQMIPVYSSIRTRTRNTNFKETYTSVIWTSCNQGLRRELNNLGLPYGRKSKLVKPPTVDFSEPDYYRGIIDGDGSVGLTGNGFPFVSLVTISTDLAEAYEGLIYRITGKRKQTAPNSRDTAYNICVFKEDAQRLASYLYYPGCLCLNRKFQSAQKVGSWVRPPNMVKVTWERRRWTPEEDAIALQLSFDEAAKKLGRTRLSVKVRKSRLVRRVPNER